MLDAPFGSGSNVKVSEREGEICVYTICFYEQRRDETRNEYTDALHYLSTITHVIFALCTRVFVYVSLEHFKKYFSASELVAEIKKQGFNG